MKKLDLHNTKHEEVRQKVISSIEHHWDTDIELQIITGYSNTMKKEVINVIKEYGLLYMVGGFLGLNRGYIVVKL